MAADLFEAFSNWPRHVRHGVIWTLIFATSAALCSSPSVTLESAHAVQWLQLQPVDPCPSGYVCAWGGRP